MRTCARRYGDPFTIQFSGLGKYVMFSDPEALREIFTGNPMIFFSGEANAFLRPFIGDNSLLLLDGERHLEERRLLLPPFHGERMRFYGELIRDITTKITDDWSLNSPLRIRTTMQEISLEVILRAVFGIEEGQQFEDYRKLIDSLLSFSNSFTSIGIFLPILQRDFGPLTPWRYYQKTVGKIDALIYEDLRHRRANPDSSGWLRR